MKTASLVTLSNTRVMHITKKRRRRTNRFDWTARVSSTRLANPFPHTQTVQAGAAMQARAWSSERSGISVPKQGAVNVFR